MIPKSNVSFDKCAVLLILISKSRIFYVNINRMVFFYTPFHKVVRKNSIFVGEYMRSHVGNQMKGSFWRFAGRRCRACMLGVVTALCFLAGCAKEKDPLEKIKDLEFTVLAEENIPEELKSVIEEKKGNAFKVTYQDNGFLYICIGYGEQVSGGYSITVNDLYLTENAMYVDTTLIGPDPADTAVAKKNTPSYPYIVIKTEFIDKPVVFD